MADEVQYTLARFVFNDTRIRVGSFKTTRKQEVEKHNSTDDHTPYSISITEESFEWEASDIDPTYRKFFDKIMDKQKNNSSELGRVVTYDYAPDNGDLIEDDVYYGAWIEELGKEDANKPFSAKGGALKKKAVD